MSCNQIMKQCLMGRFVFSQSAVGILGLEDKQMEKIHKESQDKYQ